MDTSRIQQALIDKGYSVGDAGADGVFGRLTIAALKQFQADAKIDIKFPGTVGPKTIEALGLTGTSPTTVEMPPWLELCIRKKGMHEETDFHELSKFLRSDGRSLGDPRKLPWCGDLVETCIALTCPKERLPGNPYLAANWADWGQHVKPTLGAVMSFWRGSPTGGLGHVAFYWSETGSTYQVWGGNQSNAITLTTIEKKRLRKNGSRWPLTWSLPDTGAVAGRAGDVSTNEA